MKEGTLATYKCIFTDKIHLIVILGRRGHDGYWTMYRLTDGRTCELHEGNYSLKVLCE